jgi:adenylate kinase family enzyme
LGELLRVEKKTQSPHAKLIIKSILENEKVPVDVIASVLRQAMEKAGPSAKYVIQGFPRDTDDV